MEGEVLAAPALIVALQFLAFSALATDCAQTKHWIEGTVEKPVLCPDGSLVCEGNSILAGHPDKRTTFFAWWRRVAEAAPHMLSPPAAMALLTWIALEDGRTAIESNEFSSRVGFPTYWVVAWQWHF